MVEFISFEQLPKNKPVSEDIKFIFKDTEISKEVYEHLKDVLNDFGLYHNDGRFFETMVTKVESDYDESSQILLITLNIVMPDTVIDLIYEGDGKKLKLDIIKSFKEFYENLRKNLII